MGSDPSVGDWVTTDMALYNVREYWFHGKYGIKDEGVRRRILSAVRQVLTKTKNVEKIMDLLKATVVEMRLGCAVRKTGPNFIIHMECGYGLRMTVVADCPQPLSMKDVCLNAVVGQMESRRQVEGLGIPLTLRSEVATHLRCGDCHYLLQ